jgi:tetratricopeptide (TPR) repeat protein
VRAAGLRTASLLAAAQSDWATAESLLLVAREIHRAGGDAREQVLALSYLSFYARMQGRIDPSEAFAREAVEIADGLDDDRAHSAALTALGDVLSARGDHARALARYEEAVEVRERYGDPLLVTDAVYNLGMAAYHAADTVRARAAFSTALTQARELGEETYLAAAQLMLALLDFDASGPDTASERALEAYELYTHLEDDRSRARCVVVLAAAAAARGDRDSAARLLGAAQTLRADAAPDEFETPLLERVLPELEQALEPRALAELVAEGRSRADVVSEGARA